jgi:microcystin-dependent protein
MPLNLIDPAMTVGAFNDQQVPIGTVQVLTSASMPKGWLLCDGTAYSQITYSALFAVVGTTFGNPGGGNFNVPNIPNLSGNSRLRYAIKALRYDP